MLFSALVELVIIALERLSLTVLNIITNRLHDSSKVFGQPSLFWMFDEFPHVFGKNVMKSVLSYCDSMMQH